MKEAQKMETVRLEMPYSYRAANALAGLLQAAGMPKLRLDEGTLCTAAMKQTGLSDFGNPYYREGFMRLLESAEEDARLHPLGRFMTNDFFTNYLAQRLLLMESLKKEPQIYQQKLVFPLIIVGLARSGTTFLHKMLALDPNHRALPMWQLMYPFPEKPADNNRRDRRQAQMERTMRFRQPLLPGIDAIHYMRADTPEECILVLGLTFNSNIFGTLSPLYGYVEWYLENTGSLQKYEEYSWLLKHFQSQEPEQRLVLKAPAHTGNLEPLTQTIPNAMIIQTHRDPVVSYVSACSLVKTYHLAMSNEVDVPRMAEQCLRLYELWLKRSIEFREAHPGVIYDVFYDGLVSNPIGTVRGIYSNFQLPWSNVYEAELRAFVTSNPKDKHGKHHYKAADFGLTDGEINERLRFYSDYFDLEATPA
jgi:hypothetical protein